MKKRIIFAGHTFWVKIITARYDKTKWMLCSPNAHCLGYFQLVIFTIPSPIA